MTRRAPGEHAPFVAAGTSSARPTGAPTRRSWLLGAAAGIGAALVPGCTQPVTVYLVRHAEKLGPAMGAAPEKDPQLSELGQRRATKLDEVLRDAKLVAVFSTEFKRTHDTVSLTAASHGLEVTVVPANATATLVEKIRSFAGGEVLVSGHSNTVPEIAAALGVSEPLTLGDDDYGDLFVVASRGSSATLERRRFDPA